VGQVSQWGLLFTFSLTGSAPWVQTYPYEDKGQTRYSPRYLVSLMLQGTPDQQCSQWPRNIPEHHTVTIHTLLLDKY
jgi:hypothetical protein